MARARIRKLELTRFRSYAHAELALDGRAVVLFGANGAGKTNLLEALSLLTPGKGLRAASAAELGRRTPDAALGGPWAVSARVEGDAGTAQLGTGLIEGAARRTVRIEGETLAPTRLAQHLRLVWLTPANDRLFLEPAAERRRFLDRLVFAAEPEHATRVARYERGSRERLHVLVEARDGGREADGAWLDAIESQLAVDGLEMARARARGVAALALEIEARDAGAFPRARLSLIGDWAAPGDPDDGARLVLALARGRSRDAAAARALTGPHRVDLHVVHPDTGRPAAEGSTGEQKALGLNLVLAQAARLARAAADARNSSCAESPPEPILLLDEVAAHLDLRRRAALFDEILALGLQTFLTGTDRSLFHDLEGRAQFVHVDAGRLALDASETDPR